MARVGQRQQSVGLPALSIQTLRRHQWLRDARRAAVSFWRDNCMGMAGMIAFFGFLSLIPLVILLLAVVGNVLGGLITEKEIERIFHGAVPGLSKKEFLHSYWYPIQHSKVATTILGAVSLLLGTLGLHDSVDWAVNRLWRSQLRRNFWISKARGVGVVVWATAFAVLSLGLTSLWALMLNLAQAPGGLATTLTALTPSVLVDVGVFTALYRLPPTVPVRLRPALAGGIVGATLWDISKIIFGWWVLRAGTYDRVYGPLAASVIVMLWLWISAMIFLYGAALAAAIQFRRAEQQPAPDSWWYDT